MQTNNNLDSHLNNIHLFSPTYISSLLTHLIKLNEENSMLIIANNYFLQNQLCQGQLEK